MMPRFVILLLKINHLLVVPWVVLSVPPAALFQQQVAFLATLSLAGLVGMLTRRVSLTTAASASTLLLIVWGRIASDIYQQPGPDSALLLFQFMLVIFLMEASRTILALELNDRPLEGKSDELSLVARAQVASWAEAQVLGLGKLTLAAFLLSLGLLVIGSLASVSVSQFAFSGVLVMVAVVAILVVLTYRREPENQKS